jgi:hypothetical protein
MPQDSSHERNLTYFVSVTIVLTAFWLALGDLNKGHHGDSVILSLVSQQHWSPYFWETNRYGMLLPLLAKPFRNPLTNLIVIVFFGTLSGLACSFLLIKYFFPERTQWLAAAALQNIWLFTLTPAAVQFDWFVVQCYGVSLTLGLASLILLNKQKFWWALFLLLVTHWVNSAAFIVLSPLLLLRHLIERRLRGLVSSLVLLGFSAGSGIVAMHLAHYNNTDTGLLPPRLWPNGWAELLRMTHLLIVPSVALLLWILIPSLICLAILVFAWSGKRSIQTAFGLTLIGIAYWLFSGSLVWVRMSTYAPRYIYISLLLLSLALAIVIVPILERVIRSTAWIGAIATVLMFLTAVAVYGSPSIARIHRDIDEKYGRLTPEILESGVNLIAGDYWVVWPAVFHANLSLYERGETRRIYGLSYRDQNTFPDWSAIKGACVAVPLSAYGQDSAHSPDFWMRNSPRHFSYRYPLSLLDVYCEP